MKIADNPTIRIAVVEDDPVITELISITLDEAGWHYRLFGTIAAINDVLGKEQFDLYLLDWSLPDGEVDTVVTLIRQQYQLDTPILIESVDDDEDQIVKALGLGADDYVTKPLRMSELKARISALVRRNQNDVTNNKFISQRYQADAMNFDILLDQEPLQLSNMEYKLAVYLFQHMDMLLTRDQLLADVWDVNNQVDTRTVDTHVSRLRKKLRLDSDTGLQLTTLRGYGYRLEEIDKI